MFVPDLVIALIPPPMKFLDSVHRDRVTASGKIIRKAEVVIKVRSIYRKVRGTAIATGKTHVGGIRRKACDIGDTTVNGG